jgi:hypothetical protein
MSDTAFPGGDQAILLFLSKQDAKSLLDILIDCDLSKSWHGREEERIRLCDRLAHAMDAFKIGRRRLST